MDPIIDFHRKMNRRSLFAALGRGIGQAALGSLLIPRMAGSTASSGLSNTGSTGSRCPISPQSQAGDIPFPVGGPSHLDLFDYKPQMRELHGQELPDSVRGNHADRMTANQSSFPSRPHSGTSSAAANGERSATCFPTLKVLPTTLQFEACIRKPSTMIRQSLTF